MFLVLIRCNVMNYVQEHKENIPLEITYYFSLYIKSVFKRGLIDAVTYSWTMNNGLFILVESLTGFERVLKTPIPLGKYICNFLCIDNLQIFIFSVFHPSHPNLMDLPFIASVPINWFDWVVCCSCCSNFVICSTWYSCNWH